MSVLSTLQEQVYDDVYAVVDTYTTNPHHHVIREDDNEPDEPPMVALDGQTRQRSASNSKTGIHDLRVSQVFTNPFDVKFGEEKTFAVDVTIGDVDGNRANNILSDIQNSFSYDGRFRDAQSFLSSVPIDDVRVNDTSPIGTDGRLGHTLSIEIDYLRTFLYSDVNDPPSEVTEVVTKLKGKTLTTDDSGSTLSE